MKIRIIKQDSFIYPYRKSVVVPDEHVNEGVRFNLDTKKFFTEKDGKVTWQENG